MPCAASPSNGQMLRIAACSYILISVAMIATSFITGHRAKAITGKDHYLLTATRLLVDVEVAPDNPADAAFDAAQREAGETTLIPEWKPIFVLGFADATGPVVVGGGLVLLAWWSLSRLRRGPYDRSQGLTKPIS